MPYRVIETDDSRLCLELSGALRKAELEALQSLASRALDTGRPLRLLVVLDRFEGWAKGDDWANTRFLDESGRDAARMAFVGEPRWKDDVLAFMGYGLRPVAMAYFPPGFLDQAKAWLASSDAEGERDL